MKYCPNCGSEYFDEIDICSDCNIGLVNETEYGKMRETEDAELEKLDKLSRICVLESKFEGDVISDALEREDVTFIIKEFKDTAYNGLFIPQLGWGEVMVPDADAKRAERIVQNIRKNISDGKKNHE
ncbi:MAG: hypothetical protein ABID54_01940 [Pseudomonadota bacterium]